MSLDQEHLQILKKLLEDDYFQFLPPLLDTSKSAADQLTKNLSRAFGAFAIQKVCGTSVEKAAKAVIDDFDDYGIDALFYDNKRDTLYFVQSKLIAAKDFKLEDALKFEQGIRKILKYDFNGFNQNVQNRLMDIEGALEGCRNIELIVAHIGSGISRHAEEALKKLLEDESLEEQKRLVKTIYNFDSEKVVSCLREAQAVTPIDTELFIERWRMIDEPRETHFGLMNLCDLIKLHEEHTDTLYEKNIRTFLGNKTEVNSSIQLTLSEKVEDFVYLNNGVTALCNCIDTRNSKNNVKRLVVKGLSIINGAQTIATSAKFFSDNKDKDISKAKVFFTLIQSHSEDEFSKTVTRTRNHQNRVYNADFAALDDEQERLRQDIANLGIKYLYKNSENDGLTDSLRIRLAEAANALALFQDDPRYAVWLKTDATNLQDMNSDQYKELFNSETTASQVINSVRFYRYLLKQISDTVNGTSDRIERLIYKNGMFVFGWVLAKRLRQRIKNQPLVDEDKIGANLSRDFDELRQTLFEQTNEVLLDKTPANLYKNQSFVIPLLNKILTKNFGLTDDPILVIKNNRQNPDDPYPIDLFRYLISKSPQIDLENE